MPGHSFEIKQFRRRNRAMIHHQTERIYKLNGVTVAKNRRKRMEQRVDSLAEWYETAVETYGKREADRMRAQLSVTKSTRVYNAPGRLMPGAIFRYHGRRYVMTGQLTGGKYLRAVGCQKRNFPVRECKLITQNAGLVYIA